ncbi:MAG: hypothetical protein RL125_735, partial [Actinomycetota bacterium]
HSSYLAEGSGESQNLARLRSAN